MATSYMTPTSRFFVLAGAIGCPLAAYMFNIFPVHGVGSAVLSSAVAAVFGVGAGSGLYSVARGLKLVQ